MFKRERLSCYKALFICVIAFIAGEFMLNSVAPMESPIFGRTFHIVVGCVLMILSLLSAFLLIKHLFHLNRKEKVRKRNPVQFLHDKKNKKSKE